MPHHRQQTKRIQLKEIEADAARFLCGPYVRLREVSDTKTSTITILRTGKFYHRKYGEFEITEDLLDGMVRNFEFRTYGQDIQMDVSHEWNDGNAGDFKKLWREGNRLRAVVEWTPFGIDAIKKRGFKYVSADFSEDYQDNEHRQNHGPTLFGAALVTRPHIKNMDPVQLSEDNGKTVITFIHPETIKHLKHEERNMKKLLDALKAKLKSFKLADDHVDALAKQFETVAETIKDDEDTLKKLADAIEGQGKQLADELAKLSPGQAANIQLAEISITSGNPDNIDDLIEKKLADQAEATAKKLSEDKAALDAKRKIFTDAIDAAEGLSDDTVKQLNESIELITANMSDDQVTRLAELQIAQGNQIEAGKKLAQVGYHLPGVDGNVHITVDESNKILGMQETINKRLMETSKVDQLKLLSEDKLPTSVKKILKSFDYHYGPELHEEAKRFADGEVDMASTALPVGVQRTVIREQYSDLNVMNLVTTDTDPNATSSTDIPYEVRDVDQVINDGLVSEGQEIPPGGIEQRMDSAFLRQMKISMNISNEAIFMTRASVINWDAYARNVESNARLGREMIHRRLCNEMQRASDGFMSNDIPAENVTGQLDGGTSLLKTAQYPIIRPHQVKNLAGENIGNAQNPITVTINSNPVEPWDGSGSQAAGTYYRITSFNLGYILLVDEAGNPVTPANTGANTIGYSYSTNVLKVDLDIPADVDKEKHYNNILQGVGARKAILSSDRFVEADFLLMSPVLNDTATNAEQFTASGSKSGSALDGKGDLEKLKSVESFKTNAPAVDLGDERILMGRQGVTNYKIAKPFMTGQPMEAVGPNGRPIGKKVAYGEEYSAIHTPLPIRGHMTSVLVYSFGNR